MCIIKPIIEKMNSICSGLENYNKCNCCDCFATTDMEDNEEYKLKAFDDGINKETIS